MLDQTANGSAVTGVIFLADVYHPDNILNSKYFDCKDILSLCTRD